ncbi:Retrovirus-related Pol polyprotein from transposon RE1 [Bienertia sinuspersici]
MVSCNQVKISNSEWILDSGATHHMTSNKNLIYELLEMKETPKISLPTGQTSGIIGTGKVKLRNGMELKNVMLIPSFQQNLFSIQKLSRDSNCKVMFLDDYCVIQDNITSEVRGLGKARKGLYYLINESIPYLLTKIKGQIEKNLNREKGDQRCKVMSAEVEMEFPARMQGKPKPSAATLWHMRLGHAPMRRIQKIEGLNGCKNSDEKDVCIICQLVRFIKLPYTISQLRASKPFELIHLDIWGPYKVSARGGYKYFMTVVDDHSRVTWVTLLKQKSEAFETIERFVMVAANQFESKVKLIRSDNALEFDDSQCNKLYHQHDIIHQTSCVDTPQQNGRVERKHRSILEMARALRFEADCHFISRVIVCIQKCTSPTDCHAQC